MLRLQHLLLLTISCMAAALWASLGNQPLHDLPNHMARATVMADLLFHHGANFGAQFDLQLSPIPYVLGDLVVAAFTEFVPAHAGELMLALCYFSVPVAAWFLARSLDLSPWARGAFALASTVMASDQTLLLGFVAYRLSLPLLLLALGFAVQVQKQPTPARIAGYVACVAAGYLMHLAMPLFLLPAVLVLTAFPRDRTASRTAKAWLPTSLALAALPAALLAINQLTSPPNPDRPLWMPVGIKLATALEIVTLSKAYLAVLVLCMPCIVLALRAWRDALALRLIAVAACYGLANLLLPTSQGLIWFIDGRAVPLEFGFLAFACVAAAEARPAAETWSRLMASIVFAAFGLASLLAVSSPLAALDARNAKVREVIEALPPGAAVLPITTRDGTARLQLHAAELAVYDRRALTPYLFSGDQQLPQRYFRYRDRPYAPLEHWVTRSLPIDWSRVGQTWPYLLVVGSPGEVEIPIRTRTLRSNGWATLLKVEPSGP